MTVSTRQSTFYFNPRPPRGGRRSGKCLPLPSIYFNPRPPRGGRPYKPRSERTKREFQSTPPARGATVATASPPASMIISIHAPREGGDTASEGRALKERNFNPRPPRGGRLHDSDVDVDGNLFQSTPPARGATCAYWCFCSLATPISIHAPREGGDRPLVKYADKIRQFQSTPPARGATALRYLVHADNPISIHAPREGGDNRFSNNMLSNSISIHAPREGGDSKDAQFYLRIFDKQVELLRFLGKIRGGCLRNPEKDRRFLGKSLANLPEISGHLDFAGGGKARPGYPCAVPLPRRAACVRGSGDPPADRCSSYRNAPLFSHIASLDSKSADCLSQNP